MRIPLSGPVTSVLTIPRWKEYHLNLSEFLEPTCQNFRNPQTDRANIAEWCSARGSGTIQVLEATQ